MSEKHFSSSEVQKIFQITRPTLRYYMDKGLIKGKKDPDSGYLSFGEDDLNDLADVSFFRRVLGFNTKELDGYFRASSLTDYSSVLFMHKEILKQEIRKREKQLEILSLMEEWLDMVMETENKIREIHFDEEYSILAPLKKYQESYFFLDDREEEDLCWFCDLFSLQEDSRGEYQGFGFYVDLLSCRKLEYDADRYELIRMRPGDYLYGVYSSTIDFRDPAVLEPFFDYAKEHHLKLGNTACLSLQFINRKENVRTYYYDVTIPIMK